MTWKLARGAPLGAALVLAALVFAGCSDDDDKKDGRPVANAGADQSVVVGGTATLDGTASADPDGQTLTYQWTLASAPAGSTAALAGATTAAPTLETDAIGAYAVDLVVSDGALTSVADRVTVTATNTAPVADVSGTEAVDAGALVALTGTATDADGHPVTHAWTLLSKPAGSAAALAADAPLAASIQTDVAGSYVVRLAVDDGWAETTDSLTITAASPFTGGAVAGTEAAAGAELTAIAARIDAVLALGYNTVNADAVMKRLTGNEAGRPASSMKVIDVRSEEDFAKGHIPGAINIPLARLPDAILGNPAVLGTVEIAVASYNGGDGNMANLLVNLARVPDPVPSPLPSPITWPISRSIFGGMTAWSFDRELSPTRFDDDRDVRRVEDGTVTATATPGAAHPYPAIGAFSAAADTVTEKIMVRARQYLGTIAAEDRVWVDFVQYRALLADADPANDPPVLSARSAADYAKGHVPGAVNVVWQQVAKVANATFVDPARETWVYCYTGHTGGVATMALGLMGYNVRNLLYGLNGWTLSSAAAAGQLRRFDIARAWDFPLHDTDGGVASLETYAPPQTGCKGCHANLTAIYAHYAYTEPPAPGVVSEGEG